MIEFSSGVLVGSSAGKSSPFIDLPPIALGPSPPRPCRLQGRGFSEVGLRPRIPRKTDGLLTEGLGSSLSEARSPPEFQMELVRWAGGLTESETQGRGPGRRCKFGITRHINLKPREWMRPPNKCKQAEERYRAGPGGVPMLGKRGGASGKEEPGGGGHWKPCKKRISREKDGAGWSAGQSRRRRMMMDNWPLDLAVTWGHRRL